MNFLQCNSTNYKSGRTQPIEYIVVHYTGNNGDTANGNASYFANNAKLSASAHYFVDENEVWQSVKDTDVAWHCGGGLQGVSGHAYYRMCFNSNSLGVEMCSRLDSKGKYYIHSNTVTNAVELVLQLMEQYGVSADKVIRHYDVTGKNCPAPFVEDSAQWVAFKSRLISKTDGYKNIIQEKCGFSNPADVWECMDKHKYADALYKTWAESYG